MAAHADVKPQSDLVPSEFAIADFQPPWWLRNRHLMSLWANRVQNVPTVRYRRERLLTPDDDFVDLDWIDGDPQQPLVLGCHGLEGCSESRYLLRLMGNVGAAGWSGVALNYRGCSGEDNRKVHAYHSGWTNDLALVAQTLAAR